MINWDKLQQEFNETELTLKDFCEKLGLNYGTATHHIKVKNRTRNNKKFKEKKLKELEKLHNKEAKSQAKKEFELLRGIQETNILVLRLLAREIKIIANQISQEGKAGMDLERFIHNYTKFLGVLKDFETETSANHNDTFIIIE